ncbi:hypothetical protein EDD85DRAFT_183811 [Armillaria nabsnona]|nr:hypothetical protein EDD85DRAFT_183811 [Armillaria nabsnona]
MIVDVRQTLKIASIPSALLFYVDHTGASAAPRTVFRYESLSPANDASSIDSPPLSPSGSTSSSSTFSPEVSFPPLTSIDPISWSVTISQEIHRGKYARVWRGTLSDGSCISPVVVKMYPRQYFNVMKTEIKAYQCIYSRQLFDITPAYYGTFAMHDQLGSHNLGRWWREWIFHGLSLGGCGFQST